MPTARWRKGTIPRINDEIANLVAKNPGKLYGLATVDAYGGDDAARELTRAVRELGLRGVFIESAIEGPAPTRPAGAPDARGCRRARRTGVRPSRDRSGHAQALRADWPAVGVRLARATINSLALLSLLEGGVFDELPKAAQSSSPRWRSAAS